MFHFETKFLPSFLLKYWLQVGNKEKAGAFFWVGEKLTKSWKLDWKIKTSEKNKQKKKRSWLMIMVTTCLNSSLGKEQLHGDKKKSNSKNCEKKRTNFNFEKQSFKINLEKKHVLFQIFVQNICRETKC